MQKIMLQFPDSQGGYTGAQMGSGRNSGQQERESWKDSGDKQAHDASATEKRSNDVPTGNAQNETATGNDHTVGNAKSTQDTTRGDENARGQDNVATIRK